MLLLYNFENYENVSYRSTITRRRFVTNHHHHHHHRHHHHHHHHHNTFASGNTEYVSSLKSRARTNCIVWHSFIFFKELTTQKRLLQTIITTLLLTIMSVVKIVQVCSIKHLENTLRYPSKGCWNYMSLRQLIFRIFKVNV